AVVLAACLSQASDLAAVLACYDAQRRPRAQAVARAARRIGRVAQLHGRAAVALRTLAMQTVPAGASVRVVTRMTSWRARRLTYTRGGSAGGRQAGHAGAASCARCLCPCAHLCRTLKRPACPVLNTTPPRPAHPLPADSVCSRTDPMTRVSRPE